MCSQTLKNGYSPLHHACISGHLEITRILLTLSTDLALQFSNTGYMPLHLAAMNAKTSLFEEFEQMAPISFHHLTTEGETVFHLTVKYKHYESFIWLAGAFHNTDLFHRPDQCGNTLLHLAVSRGCDQVMNSHILIFELVMVTIFIYLFIFLRINGYKI